MSVPYVLKKEGMYYAHNSDGYVSNVVLAELYDEAYAKDHAESCQEVQAIRITDVITSAEEIQPYIDRLEEMRDVMLDDYDG